MQTVLITGGTGTIGRQLAHLLLSKNYRVIILTRNIAGKTNTENCRYAEWDIGKQTIDRKALAEADFIIHLAGAGIADGRWTAKRKKAIVNSRVNGCRLIVKVLKEIPNKVRAVISASAIGYYGQDKSPGHSFKEEDVAGNDFLAKTCQAWEEAIRPVTALDKRLIILRTGVVLDKQDGAYREFERSLQFRVATVLGKGDQVVSWIHINDMCRVYLHALENSEMRGVYNSCAPDPVSNKQLVSLMARQKFGTRFLYIKVPAFLLRLFLGELADAALLSSAAVSAEKLISSGFTFLFPTVEAAVSDLNEKYKTDG